MNQKILKRKPWRNCALVKIGLQFQRLLISAINMCMSIYTYVYTITLICWSMCVRVCVRVSKFCEQILLQDFLSVIILIQKRETIVRERDYIKGIFLKLSCNKCRTSLSPIVEIINKKSARVPTANVQNDIYLYWFLRIVWPNW